jgi:hypothetical protein
MRRNDPADHLDLVCSSVWCATTGEKGPIAMLDW